MSLLQKASIITTPTAYAEDYLYSIKPAYALGSELVTNGNFATDSDWGKGSGWTISGGKANRSGESGNSPITQNVPVVNGRKYTFSYTRKYLSGSSGHTNIFVKLDNVNYSTIGAYISTVVEEHIVTGEFTALFTGNLLWQIYGIGDFTGYIDNVSIKELTDADFDFDRNSTGTRVNEDYLIEDVPYNLLRYTEAISTDFGVTDVTLTDNYSLSASGTQTSTRVQLTNLGQSRTFNTVTSSVVSGQSYTFSFYYKGTQGQTVYISALPVGGTEVSKAITLNGGWQRESVTFTAGSSSNYVYFVDSRKGGTATDFEVWGAQLVKGDQAKDYLKTTDRLDIPRIDYTNGEPSILLEPSRTNLITYSNDFTQSNWSGTQGLTLTANNAISPEGITNATKLEVDGSNSNPALASNGSITIGQTYTLSIFVKNINFNGFVRLAHFSSSQTGAWFDLDKGEIKTVNSTSATIDKFPNGWYKLTNTFVAIQSTNTLLAMLGFSDSDGSVTSTVTGQSVLAYGAQLEAGSYATSLIHTSGSTVTRSADAANNAGNSDLINSTEGVLYVEFKGQNDNTFNYISVSDGGTTNYAAILCSDVDNEIAYRYYVSNSGVQILTSVSNLLEFNKIAVKWKANDFSIYINGVQVGASTSGSVNSAGTFNNVSFARGTSNNTPFYGNAKMVAVFKEALTDLELEKLTGYNNHELYMNYYNRLSYLGLVEEYNVESDINNYIL